MWQLVQTNGENADFNSISPTARTKHATCTNQDGFIYLYGGKSGNMSLKDLWRFDTENNYWEEIKSVGDHPPSLQEHSMVAWNNKIYIFGGEVGYSSQETPLWQLNLDTWTWYKFGSANINSPGISSTQPTGRSGHSAVLFENAIYIYGGYQQLKGSLTELWKFDLCNESWSLISGPCISTIQPPARHYHSAVIHGNQMYVFGGMNNLDAKSDFWTWRIFDKTWTKIKCNRGPGELYNHSAIKAFNCMFIFGGERNGNLLQELWRFNFDTENWDKIQTTGMLPSPRSRHTAIPNPFIDLPTNWDQQTDVSSSISSNNSNHSETNRISQYNYDLRTDSTISRKSDKNHSSSKSNKKSDENAQFKNEKNKENKCDCNQRTIEGTIRKFFRKRIVKNKLVRSMSTNSYNISHNENCNFYRPNQITSVTNTMKKSNTCYDEKTIKTTNQQTENRIMNSNTIESLSTNQDCTSISNSSQTQDTKNDKNKLNSSNINELTNACSKSDKQATTEFRKYDIGQLSNLNSPNDETEDFELLNKIDQLSKELESKASNKTVGTTAKKPRAKSELISGDEYMWDNTNLKPYDSRIFYSFTFSSPQNFSNKLKLEKNNDRPTSGLMDNQTSLIKTRNRSKNATSERIRPKTYHPLTSYNDVISSYFVSDLHEINELELLNDDQFITEEEMAFDGKESPTKSENDKTEIQSNNFNEFTNELTNSNEKSVQKIVENDKVSQPKIDSNTMNGTISNITTSVCSPMSTSSMMDNSISQSISFSSGYQSFMEDSITDNTKNTTTLVKSSEQTTNSPNTNSNQTVIKVRNQPNQLKLDGNRRTKRYSCNLSNFGDYEQQNDKFSNKVNKENEKSNNQIGDQLDGHLNDQSNKQFSKQVIDELNYQINNCQSKNSRLLDQSESSNFNHSSTVSKQLPNSTSNVEISSNNNKQVWERKTMIKTFSTNAFNGKDTLFNKNVQRNQSNSHSFLNLSEKVNIGSLDLNFLIKKKKNKKKEYQFCMLVFGGNEISPNGMNVVSKQPISVYKLYI